MGFYIWNNDLFDYDFWVSNMIKKDIKKEKLYRTKNNFSIENYNKKEQKSQK